MAAPPVPRAQSPRDVMNMAQGSLRMDREGQEGREREREDSVCEPHSTRVNEGKHTWRRGCVGRERERELKRDVIKGNGERGEGRLCGRKEDAVARELQ